MNIILPEKTIERLSKYRRCLLVLAEERKTHVYSHDLARMLGLTSVQVRRDMMIIGHSGTLRKGYEIRKLNDLIGKIIEAGKNTNIAIIGLGNLGKAILDYVHGKSSYLKVVASFDINEEKTGRLYKGIPCFHNIEMATKIKEYQISVAVVTTPSSVVQEVADQLVLSGIRGILNYSTKPLKLPSGIYLEEYDMITSLEKISYFINIK